METFIRNHSMSYLLKNTLADLGFLEGVTLGTRASEALRG